MKLNNSIYNGVISLKNQLASSISEQNDILDCLTNALMTDFPDAISQATKVEIPTRVLTLNTGETVEISKAANSDVISLHYVSELFESYATPTFSQLASHINDARVFPEHIQDSEDVAPVFSFRDIYNSLAEGEATNEAVAKVNELFLLNPNVSNSDIISAINTVHGGVTNDLNTLKTNVLNSSIEGKVSNYGWLTVVSNICSESKQTVDQGSLTVSEEKFFALQTFLQTVLTVASAILSAVLTVLGAIFGGLLSVLGVIFNAVGSLFSSTFDLDYDFKANASYPGIKGTFFAGLDPTLTDITDVEPNVAMRISQGSEDIFFFKQSTDTEGVYNVYVQSQPVLVFHPDRLIKYLRNEFTATITTVSGTIKTIALNRLLNPNFDADLPDDSSDNYPFLKMEDYIAMGTDKNFMIRALKANVIMAVLLRCASLTLTTTGVTCTEYGYATSDYRSKALCLMYLTYVTNDSSNTIWDTYSIADIRDCVTGLQSITDFQNSTVIYQHSNGLYVDWNGVFFTRPIHPIRYSDNSTYAVGLNQGKIIINDDIINYQTDSIATENMISIPSLDVGTIVAALAIVAGIIAATVVIGKKLNSAMKAKKQLKQTKRLTELNKFRDAYNANPTKENARAYKKAMSAYNFKASLMGWGTYDAANGWMNPPETNGISTTGTLSDYLDVDTGINGIRSLITTD